MESMDRLAIIQGKKIVEKTVRFSIKVTIQSMARLAIIEREKKRLDFQVRKLLNFVDRLALFQSQKIVETTGRFSSKKSTESMNRSALNQGQNTAKTTVRYSIKWTIESMDRLAIIQGQKILETMVRTSSKKTIGSMDS